MPPKKNSAGQALAEHEEQLFYVSFRAGHLLVAWLGGPPGPWPGSHFKCGRRLAPKSSHKHVPLATVAKWSY